VLGPLKLDVLTLQVVQAFVDQVATGRVRKVDRKRFRGKQPAPATVAKVHATLESLLKEGVRQGLLPNNPARFAVLPRIDKTLPVLWTRGELADVIDMLPEHHRLAVRVASDTGLRAGELWGLQVGDLDLAHERLFVRRALKYVRNQFEYGPTKTYQARTIVIPTPLVQELAARLGNSTGRRGLDAPLFTSATGCLVHHGTFLQRHWKPAQRLVLPLHRHGNFHALRHRHASLLLDAGAPVLAVSKRLGHKSVRTTLDIYGHLLDDADGRLADLWSSI
jgi:integrase